ncbi:hypothetical protein EVAR_79036_1 [Eumeta japonica]|uniref:Uncharacterized protein n=1 Tax=Eumeta variegata TaxID=151549 RepID=A0A4C1XS19_EUMVA|nr:hypothetical protein EVAR_79036_1 [Eumeta japonica]
MALKYYEIESLFNASYCFIRLRPKINLNNPLPLSACPRRGAGPMLRNATGAGSDLVPSSIAPAGDDEGTGAS